MQKSRFSSSREPFRPQKQSNYSLTSLQALNKRMETEAKDALNFLEELKKQRGIQNKTSKVVGEGIDRVEQNGKFYASRLEEEKTKHKNLMALVEYYEDMLYQDKMNRYEEQKTQIKRVTGNSPKKDQETEKAQTISREKQLAELTLALKEHQRTYDSLVLKTNTSSYELSKKMDQVRVLRSERTVCSGLFDQFQRQIFQHQLLYKKLVIERTVLDSIFKQKVADFNRVAQQTQKHCDKLISNNQNMLLADHRKMLSLETEGAEQIEHENI